jgi:hypothetical protein
MAKKDHWLLDFCKPYIKDTGESYNILKKWNAFGCGEDGRNGFSCSGGDTWEFTWSAHHDGGDLTDESQNLKRSFHYGNQTVDCCSSG